MINKENDSLVRTLRKVAERRELMANNENGLNEIEINETEIDKSVENPEIQDTGYKDIKTPEKNTKNGIFYTRAKKISFSVKGLTFTDIPVLKSVQLSFYEKYIILILQKGFLAQNDTELYEKLSVLLNVSEKCVKEFVEYLISNSYLNFSAKEGKFVLDKSIHFVLDKKMDNAMFAEFGVKNADCNKIVYIDGLKSFCLEDDFNNDAFRRKGSANAQTSDTLPGLLCDYIEGSREQLEPLFVRAFSNTNMHLKKDFTYNLQRDKFFDYQFEFDALIGYKYVKSEKKAIRQTVRVLRNNFLPENFILSLTEQYKEDERVPKFIELDESFYQKVTSTGESLSEIEKNIDTVNESIVPLTEEVKEYKKKLEALKKEHKKQKHEEDAKVSAILDEIASKDDEIKTNEELIADNSTNAELVKNLKNTVKQLKASKLSLEEKLGENQKTIEDLTKSFEETERSFNAQITEKEQQISTFNESIKTYEKKHNELSKEYNALLTQNEKKLHPIVKSVVDKYPASQNIFFRYISDICIWLDSAVSASEFDSFDEIGRCIDFIREIYRKTLQAVFDVILKKNVQNLGSYLTDSFNIIAIEKAFKDRKIQLDIKNKLIIFHSLANAIGHSLENGPKKKDNLQRVEDFKKLGVLEREKILLSIPNFFNSIDFTKPEISAIVAKMKV